MSERERFEAWFEARRLRTWREAGCHEDRGPTPSDNWSMGQESELWEGWQARASWSSVAAPPSPAARAGQPEAPTAAPLDMVLHCPACGLQHIDAPEPAVRTALDPNGVLGWPNPPHRSHLCHGCGHIWRPADVPTNGVAAIKTKGKADSPIAHPPARSGADFSTSDPCPSCRGVGSIGEPPIQCPFCRLHKLGQEAARSGAGSEEGGQG